MKRLAVSVVVLGLLTQPAWAARTPVHEAADSPAYGRKAVGMIGRGLINVTTSFVDLLVNVVRETQSGPPFVGTLVGLGKGAGCTTLRALSGAVDLTTFWVPGFNGFPVSDSYENCLAVAPPAPEAFEPMWEEPEAAPPVSAPPTPKEERPRYTK